MLFFPACRLPDALFFRRNALFFTYADDLPPDAGFALYSPPHLAVLALAAALCLFAARRPLSERASRALGLAILLSELLRMTVYAAMGCLNRFELPLHLCSLAVFLCALHSIRKPDWLGQTLYALCLPGACAALLFPDWVVYPFFSFISLHCFVSHTLIVLYIVSETARGSIRPRLSALWKPMLFLCAAVPPVYLFNRHFGTNYMFLQVPAPGSPLVGLAQLSGGNPAGYLALLIAAVAACMALMELPFALAHRRKR